MTSSLRNCRQKEENFLLAGEFTADLDSRSNLPYSLRNYFTAVSLKREKKQVTFQEQIVILSCGWLQHAKLQYLREARRAVVGGDTVPCSGAETGLCVWLKNVLFLVNL